MTAALAAIAVSAAGMAGFFAYGFAARSRYVPDGGPNRDDERPVRRPLWRPPVAWHRIRIVRTGRSPLAATDWRIAR